MKLLISGTFPDGKFPARAHDDDAGIDLLALESVTVRPGEAIKVQTSAVGLAVLAHQIAEFGVTNPDGLVIAGFVWDKSGLASRGITVLGGVIDQSYTKEIGVVLYNTNVRAAFSSALQITQERMECGHGMSADMAMSFWDRGSIPFSPGDKVAQLIIQDVWAPSPDPATLEMIRSAIREGARGDNGFGSTGA